MWNSAGRLSLTLCVSLALAAPVAGAQGKGAGKGGEKKAQGEQGRGAEKARPSPQAERAMARPEKAAQPEKREQRAERVDRSPARHRGSDKSDKMEVRNESRGAVAAMKVPAVARARASNNARFKRDWTDNDFRPSIRTHLSSSNARDRVVAGALLYGYGRGVHENDLVLLPVGDRVHVKNKKGVVLVDLDEDHGRNLGRWNVNPLDDDAREGSPSFCRSGAGHPVWGRQWCVDKGFSIGTQNHVRWGRTDDLGNIVFRRSGNGTNLTRDALLSLLGDNTFNRLALHAITLGYAEPLVGRWLGDATGSRVLYLTSGGRSVAEIVDVNRDDRADRLFVALRPW